MQTQGNVDNTSYATFFGSIQSALEGRFDRALEQGAKALDLQKAIGERIETPFFSSSLVQLPTVLTVLPSSKKVGVVTANGPVLEAGPAIENCGVSSDDKSTNPFNNVT